VLDHQLLYKEAADPAFVWWQPGLDPSNDRRIGFAIRYIPTMVAQLAGEDSATLVRGEDRHHHFALEPTPTRDLDPEFLALHRTITERNARILYRGTDIANYNEPKALAQRD
jgi:hypothetical protein